MNTKMVKVFGLLAIAVMLLAVSGCVGSGPVVRVGDLQTESRSVARDGAGSVRVEIEMGAGELDLGGGAAELLEADFVYNVAELKPEVEYDGGTLAVRTPSVRAGIGSLWDLDDYRYEWDLRLSDDVPMEMRVSVGAGRADLRLGSLSLTELDVQRGAGELIVDLSGSAYLTQLDVSGGAGEITVDLTGDWQTDLEGTIEGGLGQRTLILPRDTGVRIKVDVGVGGVDAAGLSKDGEYYTNDAYGRSDVTLDLELEGGVGGIELRVED